MSEPKWTAEQLAAIQLRGRLLVAAAAGSGKTAVLVKRLIHRITDLEEPVDVDRFLVVTFTKAAANEMRERIGKAIDDALFQEHELGRIEGLLRQRTLLQRASITTLHSFCLELIRKYFYQLELDPAFRVADQAEAELLRQDMVEDLFETHYEQEDSDFLSLVDAFGSDRDDQPLMDHVLRLYNFAYSQVQPAEWLSSLSKAYTWDTIETLIQSEWGQSVCQGLLDSVDESLNSLERAQLITQQQGGPASYAEVIQDDYSRVELLNKALIDGDWKQVETQFQSAVKFPKLPTIRSNSKQKSALASVQAGIDEAIRKTLQEECKKLREDAKKKLNSLMDDIFTFPLELQLPALRGMGTMVQTLGALVKEFSQVYRAAKESRNILDFTDLEHFALQLLEVDGEASPIALGLKEYFAEVLVDEYQDINPVQERILELASRQEGSPNLFMVGDVKQSIYRFRMADPNLFLDKYSTLTHWKSDTAKEQVETELVIDLNKNFRSRREVVDGVNFLFRQIMTKGAGEIPYDDQAALQYGASFVSGQDQFCTAEGPIEVHLIDSNRIKNTVNDLSCVEGTDEQEPTPSDLLPDPEAQSHPGTDESVLSEDLDKVRIEARLVSHRIQQMVQGAEFQIYDKDLQRFRAVQYSDIVILMRSYSAVAPLYVEEFQRSDIPVYAETTSGYFGASEVETMLSLLKIIDNPHLDIPLAAVLRSPLVGLNGSELGKLRMMLPEGDFFEALTMGIWAGLTKGNQTESFKSEVHQILGFYEDSWEGRLEKAEEILATAPALKDKITRFWLDLQSWRTRSRRTSLADLLWSLYEETGYLSYVGTLPGGIQRKANLRVLYDRANRFESTRYRGLFRFLRFLERFQGQGKDMGNARALGENEDVVRLITVHASKGLEFPVVFVVGLGRPFNTQSLKGKVLLHSKLGLGLPIIDVANNVRYPSLIQYAVKQRLAQEMLAEELRILYVALTRAKERLFLYGNIEDFDKTLVKWQRTSEWKEISLPEGQLRGAKCFLDWIGPALARHPENLFNEASSQTNSQVTLTIPDASSRWKIHLHQSIIELKEETLAEQSASDDDHVIEECFSEIMNSEVNRDLEDRDNSECPTEENTVEYWFTEVSRRLSWQYPHQNSVRQLAKTSVSELKRQNNWHTQDGVTSLPSFLKKLDFLKRPKFLQIARTLTAAEKGTALHTVMQHLPFEHLATIWPSFDQREQIDYILEFLKGLERREILTAEQKDVIQAKQVVEFLESPLGQRLFKADKILREVPFTLTVPCEDQSTMLVQGVIDVVIISRDDLQEPQAEILDYKTDSLNRKGETDPEETLRKRYVFQLALYAQAIEHLAKLNVSKSTLYSFSLGCEIDISSALQKDTLRTAFPLI